MEEDQIYEIEIDLKEWLLTLFRKKWILVFTTLLAFGGTIAVSHIMLTPYYESTTRIYVLGSQTASELTYWDLQMGNELTLDYQELIVSRPVLEDVIESLQLKMDAGALKSQVSISIPTDTRIVAITVKHEDAHTAMEIANAILESLKKQINQIGIPAFSVVEEASLPLGTSSPPVYRNAVLGGIAGGFLGMLVISFLFILDDKMKTPWDIEKRLGISTLASIPKQEQRKSKHKK